MPGSPWYMKSTYRPLCWTILAHLPSSFSLVAGLLPQLKIIYPLSSCFFRNGKSPPWSETSHPRLGPSHSEPFLIQQDLSQTTGQLSQRKTCQTGSRMRHRPFAGPAEGGRGVRVPGVSQDLQSSCTHSTVLRPSQTFFPGRRQALRAGAPFRPQVDEDPPDPARSHHHSPSSLGGQPHQPCRHLDPLPPHALGYPGQDHTAPAHHRSTSRADHLFLQPQSHVPQGGSSSRFVREALYPP